MLWEIAQSRREHRIRRGGEEEKAEDFLSREQLEEARLLPGLCSCSSLCAKQQQSVRNMAGGARKENRRERGTAHCMFAVTQPRARALQQ